MTVWIRIALYMLAGWLYGSGYIGEEVKNLAALMHSTGRFGDERQAFAGCATPQASFASRRS